MYTFIETQTKHPDYFYHEDYKTYEEAYERMRTIYHTFAVEGNPETIIKATINDNNAMMEESDGNQTWWRVIEIKEN